jgi:hypothetical protein
VSVTPFIPHPIHTPAPHTTTFNTDSMLDTDSMLRTGSTLNTDSMLVSDSMVRTGSTLNTDSMLVSDSMHAAPLCPGLGCPARCSGAVKAACNRCRACTGLCHSNDMAAATAGGLCGTDCVSPVRPHPAAVSVTHVAVEVAHPHHPAPLDWRVRTQHGGVPATGVPRCS